MKHSSFIKAFIIRFPKTVIKDYWRIGIGLSIVLGKVFTFAIDTRSGVGIIEFRIGLKREGVPVEDDTNLLSIFIRENEKHEVSCVLVD